MKNCKMGCISAIETLGLMDGPGIRVVVFMQGCKLRCDYCHNPEMWNLSENNYSVDELVNKIKRYKTYFNKEGGVTFSGGEPLLQVDFLIEVCKKLKKENINIALDTAGVGIGKYKELLKYVDLIIFDVKHTDPEKYFNLTHTIMKEESEFLKIANELNKKFWVRQVIIPEITDSLDYIKSLNIYIKRNIKNVLKVEFLPFHRLGEEKYVKLGLDYKYKNKDDMDKEKCEKLYKEFLKLYNTENS